MVPYIHLGIHLGLLALLFSFKENDMLYNKRPLIYIPKKKKIVENTPAPVEASTAIRVLTQYLRNPSNQSIQNWQYPARIVFSPTVNGFSIGSKPNTSFLADGTSQSVLIVPIVEQLSTENMVAVSRDLRWTPIAPTILTASTLWRMPYAFFIGSDNDFPGLVLKIRDNSQSDPYNLPNVMLQDEAIPGMTTPQFRYQKLYDPIVSNATVIGRIRIALSNVYNRSTKGTLIFSDTGYTLWNDATLLSFANQYTGNYYGVKTTVADLVI